MQVGPPTQQSQEPVSPQGLESWETVFLGPFLLRNSDAWSYGRKREAGRKEEQDGQGAVWGRVGTAQVGRTKGLEKAGLEHEVRKTPLQKSLCRGHRRLWW